MNEKFTLQAISGVTDPEQIRVVIFVNNELVHVPLAALVANIVGVSGTATYDPPSLADGAGTTTTVTVTGATMGDIVEVSFSNSLQGVAMSGWVSAPGTVSVRFQNETGAPVDLASGTIKARARQ